MSSRANKLAGAALAIATCLLSAPALAHAPGVQRALPQVSEYFTLGIAHILGGIDHLLFLAALLLGYRLQLRDVLYTVSAFTIAHSITLALGVLGVVHPNARAVEVLIALSIAYVAFENLIGRGGKARFGVTLGFGLVHGLGFASALAEVGISQTRMLPSLLLFNLGVEAGQLGVIAVLYPCVRFLQHGGARQAAMARGLSAALVAIGLIWAGERVVQAEGTKQPTATADATLGSRALARAPEPALPRSVYPRTPGTIAPDVERLCTALSALPRTRRAACTGHKAGITLASECERMLGAAVQDGAVAFSPADAERCIADQSARYASCAFTQITALTPLASCSGLLAGQRVAGATCRSSLECTNGLHCSGASPLQTGICTAPAPAGARCGLGTDPLAAYLPARQTDHPECDGACVRNRCEAAR